MCNSWYLDIFGYIVNILEWNLDKEVVWYFVSVFLWNYEWIIFWLGRESIKIYGEDLLF